MLDIPIDYYISVDMAGIQKIVDAIGGIDLAIDQAFKNKGIAYAEGMNHLDGAATLAYSRIRNDQTGQNTGRQARQRRVIQAITDKVLTMGDVVELSGTVADVCRECGDELPNCGLFGFAEIRLCSCGQKHQAGGFGRRRQLAARPGLTGMWQVSGRSDITDFEEVVALDTEYICNFSLGLYLKILFKTIMVVLGRKGSV